MVNYQSIRDVEDRVFTPVGMESLVVINAGTLKFGVIEIVRVITSLSCSPEEYVKMVRFYGKGNISPCIMALVNNDICGKLVELEGVRPAMQEHIKAAVAAGKKRWEAEQDFGRMFPDDLWYDNGGSHERYRFENEED